MIILSRIPIFKSVKFPAINSSFTNGGLTVLAASEDVAVVVCDVGVVGDDVGVVGGEVSDDGVVGGVIGNDGVGSDAVAATDGVVTVGSVVKAEVD